LAFSILKKLLFLCILLEYIANERQKSNKMFDLVFFKSLLSTVLIYWIKLPMAQEIRLPKLGETMEEGIVVACRVKLGDEVRCGDVLFEIETDKATVELESSSAGVVRAILVEIAQAVPVNAPLVVIGSKDEVISQQFIDALKAEASSVQASASVVASPPNSPLATAEPTSFISPPQYKLGQKLVASPLQKTIAKKMLQSKREIPCFYLNIRVDITELAALRAKLNSGSESKLSFNDFIIFAMGRALRHFPIMTGRLAGDYIELAESIGIGLAVAVPDGFVVPVLKDADKKDIQQIAAETKTIIEKVKAGRLAPADVEGGCITLSNLGAFGVESFIAIVVPGQCSILGVGKIMETCVPADGDTMTIRKLMSLTLAVDHKVANGAYAAQFLEHIKKLLEDPAAFT
jgi:pyruvate dehydrogenase E2 component (dihydrolipoamide acetyltransferase)